MEVEHKEYASKGVAGTGLGLGRRPVDAEVHEGGRGIVPFVRGWRGYDGER